MRARKFAGTLISALTFSHILRHDTPPRHSTPFTPPCTCPCRIVQLHSRMPVKQQGCVQIAESVSGDDFSGLKDIGLTSRSCRQDSAELYDHLWICLLSLSSLSFCSLPPIFDPTQFSYLLSTFLYVLSIHLLLSVPLHPFSHWTFHAPSPMILEFFPLHQFAWTENCVETFSLYQATSSRRSGW